MDITTLTQELRNIFLDHRTTVRTQETDDGSGKRYIDYELECTKEQEDEANALILECFQEKMNTLIDRVYSK